MVAYTQNELVSATEISKQFGEYISKVKNGLVHKKLLDGKWCIKKTWFNIEWVICLF